MCSSDLLEFTLVTGSAGASTFTVTNVNSSGPGSLNQAIANATSHPGADTITFASSTNHHVLPDPDTVESDISINGNGAGRVRRHP